MRKSRNVKRARPTDDVHPKKKVNMFDKFR
jgi:hypothetical protein